MSKKMLFMSLLALLALALSACTAQAATTVEAETEAAAAESSEAESAPADEGQAQPEGENEGEPGGPQGGQPGPQGGQPGPGPNQGGGPQGGQPGPSRGNPGGPNAGGWQAPHISGEILSIDGEQFTMEGRGDDELTVLLNDETSFIGSAESLADLAVGDEVAIAGRRGEEEGTLEAHVIMLAADLPLGTPMGGEVSAAGSDSITLETRGGQSFIFAVNEDSDYLSRENAVQSLADIEVGQHVVVVFAQAEDGTLVAKLIVAGGQPEEAPEGEEAPDTDTAG